METSTKLIFNHVSLLWFNYDADFKTSFYSTFFIMISSDVIVSQKYKWNTISYLFSNNNYKPPIYVVNVTLTWVV